MTDNLPVREATERLVEAIRDSDAYREYKSLRDVIMAEDTNRALLKEYQRTQTRLQMDAVSGHEAAQDDVQRFNQLTSLLYMNGDMARYLVAQLRLQQLTGDVFQRLTAAAELDLELPGM